MNYILDPKKRREVLIIHIPTRSGNIKKVSATGRPEKGMLAATKNAPAAEVEIPAISQDEIKYLMEIKHGHAKLFVPSGDAVKVIEKSEPKDK